MAIADAVKERLKEIRQTLPPGFKTQVVGDQSIFIKASIESIQTHLIEGSILAAIVVFIFLWSFRSTVIAAIAIPTSIIATFGLMAAMGFTLNQITMLALTLMVGIVIDDAIVVLENIFRFIEEKGMPPFQAAIEGTRGDRPRGHGDYAFAARGLLAGRLYGRHRRAASCRRLDLPLHSQLRFHCWFHLR